jgi:GAF domain-containing protein
MPFVAGLLESLQVRNSEAPAEFTSGDDLEQVLNRHLLAIEAMADVELITSILLLSHDGKRLFHGAAPRLPQSYCDAVDGSEIGPSAGSCGTAAYWDRPIYVSDIATDPLWADYRHLALPHGLRSCWSTPIREPDGALIGTFAVYRRTIGSPSSDEIESIAMITEHVAEAIIFARDVQDLQRSLRHFPRLRLVSDNEAQVRLAGERLDHLSSLLTSVEHKIAELHRLADENESQQATDTLKATAELSLKLVVILRRQIDEISSKPSP